MDNLSKDNFGVEDVEKLVSGVKNVQQTLKDNKRRKEAIAFVNRGEYWQLSPYAKSLIPIPNYIVSEISGKGITQEAVLNLPKQAPGTSKEVILQALQLASGLQTPSTTPSTVAMEKAGATLLNQDAAAVQSKISKAMPYIIGVVVIGVIVYFISKK